MDERQTEPGMGVIAQAPLPPAIVGGPTEPSLPTLTGSFLGISARRAYRLNIQTSEVLVQERAALESQARHITDPDQQAFLAWRRSILLVVAVMFVPLSVSRVFEAFDGPQLSPIGRAFKLLPAITEALFCIVAFDQLKNWTQWRKQRRILFIAWGLYFLAPFVVYLFPFRSVFDNLGWKQLLEATKVGDLQLLTKQNVHMLVGLVFGVEALLALGPKVISLMPGLIRASIVTKLLFPGTTAPGWLMMLAAPFYALFAYIIVLLPYQVTGSWHFVAGNAGLLVAQVFIGISGRRLTVPLTNAEAQHRIHRTWLAYILMLVVSAVFMVYGLTDFIRALHLGAWRVVSSVLTVVSNVLLDTLVGTDAIVTAMAFFRRRDVPDPAHAELLKDAERKLDVFCA
ncbi:MAG TPA: hypothetical protein VGG28_13300 [Kofleriaceae bacterium]|jgi:hypothetical protein